MALSRACYYRYSNQQTRSETGANEAVSDTEVAVTVRAVPNNALSAAEQVQSVLNRERFADQPPAEVYATLLSEGSLLLLRYHHILPATQSQTNGRTPFPT